MTGSVFDTVVVPIASREDAEATAAAVAPRLADGGRAVVVHVVEKAGGAPDKASVEQREAEAEEAFATAAAVFEDASVDYDTRILYGTDVVETVLDAAAEEDATAIVFTPRGGSRWAQLLTGDVARRLVERADRPVVILPEREDSAADGEREGIGDREPAGDEVSDAHE